MTLKELSQAIPGYCILLVHTQNDEYAGKVSRKALKFNRELAEASVINALPISSYTMEIVIEFNPKENPELEDK